MVFKHIRKKNKDSNKWKPDKIEAEKLAAGKEGVVIGGEFFLPHEKNSGP